MGKKKDKEEEKFVLTPQACMQYALHKHGVDVTLPEAKEICYSFLEIMDAHGHIKRKKGK